MQHEKRSPKSQFLQIRLTPSDRERIDSEAEAEHLDSSTWARRILLRELELRATKSPPMPVADE